MTMFADAHILSLGYLWFGQPKSNYLKRAKSGRKGRVFVLLKIKITQFPGGLRLAREK